MKDKTGLGLRYRMLWRLEYAGLTVFGPAQVTTQGDPKSRLRLERAQRVKAAHEQRGTTPPQEVLDVIARDGGPEPFHVRNRAR